MVDEILLRQEAEKAGVSVSNNEVLDVLLENPPDYLRRPFTDSLGRFNKQQYLELVTNPDRLRDFINPQSGVNPDEAVVKFKEDLIKVEDFILKSKLQENISSLVGAYGDLLSPTAAQLQYVVDNSSADIDFVNFPVTKVGDNEVSVTDAEIASFYEKNKQFFNQKPARKIKYFTFPMVPGSNDSTQFENKFTRVMSLIQKDTTITGRDKAFEEIFIEYSGITSEFKTVSTLDPIRQGMLKNAVNRQVIGPVNLGDGLTFLRLDERKSGDNLSVKASHILIEFGANKDSSKATASKIMADIKAGGNFEQIAMEKSSDKGSGMKGGDLGYFTKGMMVKPFEEAAFAAKPGDLIGPIETQFGYHIIKVVDKVTEEIKYSEVTLKLNISTATKNTIFRDANSAKTMLEKGTSIEEVGKQLKKNVVETDLFDKNTPAIGSKALTLFAFDGKLNDVSAPVEVKNYGVVIAQISGIREKGTTPLEDIKEQLKLRLIRNKKLDILVKKTDEVRTKLLASGGLSAAKSIDSTLDVRSAAGIRNNGFVQGLGKDYALTNAAFTAPIGSMTTTIRGENSCFLVVVKSRVEPDKSKIEADKDAVAKKLAGNAKAMAYYGWMNDLKNNADIVKNSRFFSNN
jgi:parvulin-like peptidyl-prolyl isomerase